MITATEHQAPPPHTEAVAALDRFVASLSMSAADRRAACNLGASFARAAGQASDVLAVMRQVSDANFVAQAALAIALKTAELKIEAAEASCLCKQCVARRRRAAGRLHRLRSRLRRMLQWAERRLA